MDKSKSKSKRSGTSSTKSFLAQNTIPELIKRLNALFNHKIEASYTYMAMANYFTAKGLHGWVRQLTQIAREKRSQAILISDYLSMRGSQVTFSNIKAPLALSYASPVQAAVEALEMERRINEQLLEVHSHAVSLHDASLVSFLDHHFLPYQDLALRERAEMVTKIRKSYLKRGMAVLENSNLSLGLQDKNKAEGAHEGNHVLPQNMGEPGEAHIFQESEVTVDDAGSHESEQSQVTVIETVRKT